VKSIQAEYDETSQKTSIKPDAKVEDWAVVCENFNDDVSRICDVSDIEDYTGLFECFDEKNIRLFYLVKEEKDLYRKRHRHFLQNLGLE
jgi:hypothetical protein